MENPFISEYDIDVIPAPVLSVVEESGNPQHQVGVIVDSQSSWE